MRAKEETKEKARAATAGANHARNVKSRARKRKPAGAQAVVAKPGMVTTTVQRVLAGGSSPLLQGAERTAYAWRVIGDLPTRLSSPAETTRHRLAQWVEPTLASGTAGALSQLELPVLLVAGTADARVPAQSEAERIAREAPARAPCTVHLVQGAGHAGVTDDRLDLRGLLNEWRGK